MLRDGVTLRVECVFSHSIVTKSALDIWSVFLQDGVTPVGSGSDDLISNEGITTVGLLGAFFPARPRGVFVSSFGRPVCSEARWVPHSVVFASGEDSVCIPLTNEGVGLGPVALLPLALPWGLVCFGGLAVILFAWAFHALVFHAWGLASGSSGSRTSRYGLLVYVQGASDSLPHSSPGREVGASVFGVAVRTLLQATSLPLGMDVSPAPGRRLSVSTF